MSATYHALIHDLLLPRNNRTIAAFQQLLMKSVTLSIPGLSGAPCQSLGFSVSSMSWIRQRARFSKYENLLKSKLIY